MKEVIERLNWLAYKCEDKAITPDVKDDVKYVLEEIERLNNKNEELLSLYTTEREVKDYYKNIINELEKWLEEDLKKVYRDAGYRHKLILEVQDKLQELKGSSNNE